jgi:hypothetical protein
MNPLQHQELRIVVCIAIVGLIEVGCKKDSPVEPSVAQRSVRDFTWTIDSIYAETPGSVPMFDGMMWGSSSYDIWGAGGYVYAPDDALWHRDGARWTQATGNTIFTNNSGTRFVHGLWGSSRNNVWGCGLVIRPPVGSAMILHYDGVAWADVTPVAVQNIHGVLYDMHGISANDIWAFGYEYAVHYDGTNWKPYEVADSMIVSSITSQGSDIYLSAYSPWGKDLQQLYRFSDSTFQLLLESPASSTKFGGRLWLHNGILTCLGRNIYSARINTDGTVDTSSWRKDFDTGVKGISQVLVLSPTNVIAVGSVYLVCHFNGTDWKEINIRGPNDPGNYLSSLWAIWSNGNEAFINNYHDGIVYRGK